MPFADASGVRLHYECIGDPGAPVILLIMGVSAPMTRWPISFCMELARGGFRVVRYDNRDAGRSQKFDELGMPRGDGLAPPYPLGALVDDACGLLDALDIVRAHVVGASMGGAIAQLMAADHPDRIGKLVSIMSTTGCRGLSSMSERVLALFAAAPGPSPDGQGTEGERYAALELSAEAGRSPGYPHDPDLLRERIRKEIADGFSLSGRARQAAALFAAEDRRSKLAGVIAPTLVLHGDADELFPPDHGRDTADAVPGAVFSLIPGLGHDIPEAAAPLLAEIILEFLQQAEPFHQDK